MINTDGEKIHRAGCGNLWKVGMGLWQPRASYIVGQRLSAHSPNLTRFPGLGCRKGASREQATEEGETLNIELRTLNGAMTENIR
jgi:hypothetical protein